MTDLPDRRIDLHFDDNRLLPLLCGEHDSHLARLEAQLAVSLLARGNLITIAGAPDGITTARLVLEGLWERLKHGLPVGAAEVDAAVRFAEVGGTGSMERSVGPPTVSQTDVTIRTRRKAIFARSPGQSRYLKALQDQELVFAVGPAGTGKTYLAVAQAVAMLAADRIKRIILSRPAVEAGERLGFLPGDLREKVDPYLRPLYDALYDMLPADQVAKRLQSGEIEVAPLAFMRGRTLSDCFVILDEGQNTTPMQMKMFLTRLGEGGRMAVTGDTTQVDLAPGIRSGMVDALEVLAGVEGVSVVTLTSEDVVRHALVRRIVDAYDRRDGLSRSPPPTGRSGPQIEVDLDRESDAWEEDAAEIASTAAKASLEALLGDRPDQILLGIRLADDEAVHALNRQYRQQDKPTNVLSFPLHEHLPDPGPAPLMLGDVVLAYETVMAEATAAGKPPLDHIAHLTVHGVLHLLGHGHDTDTEAEAMESLETTLLAGLGIPDPYQPRLPDEQPPTEQ